MPRIPLIDELTTQPISPGSNLLVEYDPTSQWYAAHLNIAAGWLKAGGSLNYHIASQPRESVRAQLSRLGANVEELESGSILSGRRLVINDWYTATLSRPKGDETVVDSLRVADLSISWGQGEKEAEASFRTSPSDRPLLRIMDNASCLARFNEEKIWLEFVLTRLIPRAHKWKQVTIIGFINGIHSEHAYKTLEAAVDGVIDFRLEESGNETRDIVRIRSMRNPGYDRRWHQLKIGENLEVTIEK